MILSFLSQMLESIWAIYIHCEQILNLFVQALETKRKESLC